MNSVVDPARAASAAEAEDPDDPHEPWRRGGEQDELIQLFAERVSGGKQIASRLIRNRL
jgi:hypothetical protein